MMSAKNPYRLFGILRETGRPFFAGLGESMSASPRPCVQARGISIATLPGAGDDDRSCTPPALACRRGKLHARQPPASCGMAARLADARVLDPADDEPLALRSSPTLRGHDRARCEGLRVHQGLAAAKSPPRTRRFDRPRGGMLQHGADHHRRPHDHLPTRLPVRRYARHERSDLPITSPAHHHRQRRLDRQ